MSCTKYWTLVLNFGRVLSLDSQQKYQIYHFQVHCTLYMHLLMFNKDRSHYIATLSDTNQQGHPLESHYASLSTIHPSFLGLTHGVAMFVYTAVHVGTK